MKKKKKISHKQTFNWSVFVKYLKKNQIFLPHDYSWPKLQWIWKMSLPCRFVHAKICCGCCCLTGCSRALLCTTSPDDNVLRVTQLTFDHDLGNEMELTRLMKMGLDVEKLKQTGKIGSHTFTRTIGDYSVKSSYRDIEILRYAGCYLSLWPLGMLCFSLLFFFLVLTLIFFLVLTAQPSLSLSLQNQSFMVGLHCTTAAVFSSWCLTDSTSP